MPYLKTLKKIPYQKTLSRTLKRCLIMFKKAPYRKNKKQKKHQESKKLPYQGT